MNVHYEILGLSPDASFNKVKATYRKLANKYHPDKDTGDEQLFLKITEAYECLKEINERGVSKDVGKIAELVILNVLRSKNYADGLTPSALAKLCVIELSNSLKQARRQVFEINSNKAGVELFLKNKEMALGLNVSGEAANDLEILEQNLEAVEKEINDLEEAAAYFKKQIKEENGESFKDKRNSFRMTPGFMHGINP